MLMDIKVLLVAGPPASGKDTITEALTALDSKYVLFKKHRTGVDSAKYNTLSAGDFEQMKNDGAFVQAHYRYGRGYGVCKETLRDLVDANKLPIIHTGKIDNLLLLKSTINYPCGTVLLWEERDVLIERIKQRGPVNEVHTRVDGLDDELQEWQDRYDDYMNLDLVIRNNSIENTCEKIVDLGKTKGRSEEFYNYVKSLELPYL